MNTNINSENYVYELDGKMYINLTNKCCNACEFCIRNNADGIKGSKLILQHDAGYNGVIEQIERANFEYSEAVFCGYGEPTYALDCMLRVAQYLHGVGKITRLNTNGLGNLINSTDITRELVGKIDKVSVSLNEANAKDYVALCHPCFGEKAYEEIESFTKKCVELGLDTTLTIVSNGDKTREENCKKIAQELGAKFKARDYISNNENYT